MHNFSNTGYWLHRLTKDELAPLWAEVKQKQLELTIDTPLVNHKCELTASKAHVELLVNRQIVDYNNAYNYPNTLRVINDLRNLTLSELWVNYMSKHEFSPTHNHTGVMSFVIWLKLPYTLASECAARPYVPENINYAGQFTLLYTDALGQIRTQNLPTYEDWEGGLCLFPSTMQHTVNPFYSSDDIRISVAGNFYFNLNTQ